jgi:hypothetical protein
MEGGPQEWVFLSYEKRRSLGSRARTVMKKVSRN